MKSRRENGKRKERKGKSKKCFLAHPWLKTVETCKTDLKCCENPGGVGNIILRDFPTTKFGSQVVNKNFQYAIEKLTEY